MSVSLEPIRDAILEVLREEWNDLAGTIRDQDAPELTQLATESARYALKLAAGDQAAKDDLAYIRASTLLLLSKVQLREAERVERLLLRIVDIAARLAGQLILKIPVA